MSLDLIIDEEEYNYTYNVAQMWHSIFPEDEGMIQIEGYTGEEAYGKVMKGFIHILNHPTEMKKLQPANGWGTREGFLQFLTKLLIASINNPQHKWRADR